MRIAIPKELHQSETRVPMIPVNVKKLIDKGAVVEVESGLGATIAKTDEDYRTVGAQVTTDRQALLANADLVLRLSKTDSDEVKLLKEGCIHISYLDPFNESELIDQLARGKISALSMEMIPRTTKAQKMDALSSQASLAGYNAVITAADRLNKIFPMMMTPAGTISPARVFIIGAGVAGLQAIATAKRLGARVEAFDTRPVVAEQVQSLGAKFVTIDLGETEQRKDGYAKALTAEQLELQRKGMAKVCADSDVVITTAQVFGRKAPVIITRDMVEKMKPGSLIIDMAVDTGGNVEGSEVDKDVDVNGVRIIGIRNFPALSAVHASQMYSNNLYNFIDEFWDKEKKEFILDLEDEIIKGSLITHGGEIVNERIKAL